MKKMTRNIDVQPIAISLSLSKNLQIKNPTLIVIISGITIDIIL